MVNVLLLGATGRTGRYIVRTLSGIEQIGLTGLDIRRDGNIEQEYPNVKQESASDGAFLLPGNEVEHGEPKTIRNSPDWEYDILCDRNFFWNVPTTAFDKKADTAGNRTGKHFKLAEKTAQQIAEKSLETWYNHKVQSSLFAVGKE